MKSDEEKVRVFVLSTPEILDFTVKKEELQKEGFETGRSNYVWKKYFWQKPLKTFIYHEGHREPVTKPQAEGDLEKMQKDRALSSLLFGAFSAEETQKKRLEQMQKQDRLPLWLFFVILLVSLALNFVLTFRLIGVI